MTDRVKGLALIHREPEGLWTEIQDIVQEAVIKTTPKKRKCKKVNGWSEEAYKQLRKEEKLKAKE